MRINTNISSLTAQEAAVNTSKRITNSLEKLSTGLRINKASDDASGLAIADKLRTQATSINQGVANGNSAVSLLQIADKSMGEQSNILDTIKAKLIQANTDTTSADGRESIRKDINKLLEQLDNIAKQTNYNGTSLLQASSTSNEASNGLSFQIGETAADLITNNAIQANTAGLGSAAKEVTNLNLGTAIQTGQTYSLTIGAGGTDASGNALSSVTFTVTASGGDTFETVHNSFKSQLEASTTGSALASINTYVAESSSSMIITAARNNTSLSISTGDFTIRAAQTVAYKTTFASATAIGSGSTFTLTVGAGSYSVSSTATTGVTLTDIATSLDGQLSGAGTGLSARVSGGSLVIVEDSVASVNHPTISAVVSGNTLTGASNSTTTGVAPTASNLTATVTAAAGTGLNLDSLKALTSLTLADASSFQSVIDDAITGLNAYRGDVGSTQNQVESAVRNLMTQSTNVTAAESIIRDVDYAAESANFNKQNIISQAGSYAISQANTVQQNVLRLLQ